MGRGGNCKFILLIPEKFYDSPKPSITFITQDGGMTSRHSDSIPTKIRLQTNLIQTSTVRGCLRCRRLTGSIHCRSVCLRSLVVLILFVFLVRRRIKEIAKWTASRMRVMQQSAKILFISQGLTLNAHCTEPSPRQGRRVFGPLHEIPGTDSLLSGNLKALVIDNVKGKQSVIR